MFPALREGFEHRQQHLGRLARRGIDKRCRQGPLHGPESRQNGRLVLVAVKKRLLQPLGSAVGRTHLRQGDDGGKSDKVVRIVDEPLDGVGGLMRTQFTHRLQGGHADPPARVSQPLAHLVARCVGLALRQTTESHNDDILVVTTQKPGQHVSRTLAADAGQAARHGHDHLAIRLPGQ